MRPRRDVVGVSRSPLVPRPLMVLFLVRHRLARLERCRPRGRLWRQVVAASSIVSSGRPLAASSAASAASVGRLGGFLGRLGRCGTAGGNTVVVALGRAPARPGCCWRLLLRRYGRWRRQLRRRGRRLGGSAVLRVPASASPARPRQRLPRHRRQVTASGERPSLLRSRRAPSFYFWPRRAAWSASSAAASCTPSIASASGS